MKPASRSARGKKGTRSIGREKNVTRGGPAGGRRSTGRNPDGGFQTWMRDLSLSGQSSRQNSPQTTKASAEIGCRG